MSVRAKFRCTCKESSNGGYRVSFSVVTDGSTENKEFYKYTPSGNIEMATINENAGNQFTVGDEYFVDFTKV